ncbi:MAG: Crp/Fnr family transcriptional regulator [Solirubrobacterales bacterium]
MRLRPRPAPKDTKLKRLAKVPLFATCSKRDLNRIAALADEVDVPAGRVLMKQGEPGRECFVIMSGSAKVSVRGRRSTMLGPGDCFGEMALLHRAPRSATVTAESDSHLLVLGSRDFSDLIDDVPTVARNVLVAVAERLRVAEQAQPHH